MEEKKKKKARGSGACGIITKDLVFMSLEFLKEESGQAEKVFKEIWMKKIWQK